VCIFSSMRWMIYRARSMTTAYRSYQWMFERREVEADRRIMKAVGQQKKGPTSALVGLLQKVESGRLAALSPDEG
jgi:hypothetical protein